MIARKKPGKTGDEGGHGGAKAFFPRRLYEAIMDAENSGLGHIIAFEPSGMAFRIHKPIGFFDGTYSRLVAFIYCSPSLT